MTWEKHQVASVAKKLGKQNITHQWNKDTEDGDGNGNDDGSGDSDDDGDDNDENQDLQR